jgi:hypothetical protein
MAQNIDETMEATEQDAQDVREEAEQGNEAQEVQTDKKKHEKTFTETELENIIKKRIARERKKFLNNDEYIHELDQREKDIISRELKFEAKQQIIQEGLPAELVELVDCSDDEQQKRTLELIKKIISPMRADIEMELKKKYFKGSTPKTGTPVGDDRISQVFSNRGNLKG